MCLNKASAVEQRPSFDGLLSNHWVSEAAQHTPLELLVGSHTDTKESSVEGYCTHSIDDYPVAHYPASPSAAVLDDDLWVDNLAF